MSESTFTIADTATVSGAIVKGFASVRGTARVSGGATIEDYAAISGEAIVWGSATIIGGLASISGAANVGNVQIYSGMIHGNALISDRSHLLQVVTGKATWSHYRCYNPHSSEPWHWGTSYQDRDGWSSQSQSDLLQELFEEFEKFGAGAFHHSRFF